MNKRVLRKEMRKTEESKFIAGGENEGEEDGDEGRVY